MPGGVAPDVGCVVVVVVVVVVLVVVLVVGGAVVVVLLEVVVVVAGGFVVDVDVGGLVEVGAAGWTLVAEGAGAGARCD